MKTKNILQYIDQIRKENKVSKQSLCDHADISNQMYSKYLSGESEARFDVVMLMMEFLGIEFVPIDRASLLADLSKMEDSVKKLYDHIPLKG